MQHSRVLPAKHEKKLSRTKLEEQQVTGNKNYAVVYAGADQPREETE